MNPLLSKIWRTLPIFVLFSINAEAKNYYVSSTGQDTNNGTAAGTPWKTIIKVNGFSFAAGDSILFRRGDTFYGGIIVKKHKLNYGAYGSGAKPVISGLSTVTGWVNLGGNIWEAPVVNVNPGVNLVLRNNTIQQIGRYPNVDAANGGYLKYTAATTVSLTGPALSSTRNWTGAEVVIKENRWSLSRQMVTAHSGGLVTFTANPTLPRINYGYFFQRDSRTLDKDGEWWHNAAAKKLRMYFSNNNPSGYTVQIATIDTLFKCQSRDNITISNLSFNGSGKGAICVNGGTNLTVTGCSINSSGAEAITAVMTYNVTIDKDTVTNSLGSGIEVTYASGGTVNMLVKNCTVSNTSYIAGMGLNGDGGEGIKCIGGTGVKVLNNVITNSGYTALKWQGNDAHIKYNLVDRFCTLRDDGAGIYSWEDPGKPQTRNSRYIISNIVVNGIGNNQGTNDVAKSAQGIYFDLGSKSVTVDSNTVAYVASNAFHGNNCGNLSFKNNVVFSNTRSFSFQRFAGADLIRGITVKKNIIYPYLFRYRNLGINSPLITKEEDIKLMAAMDSNYYAPNQGVDTSLTAVTMYDNKTNYKEVFLGFSYITGTVGVEKHSIKFANTGTLEYNASNTLKIVSFPGLSKKDVYGTVYNNSVTIPAWSSKVLLPNGTAAQSTSLGPDTDEKAVALRTVAPGEKEAISSNVTKDMGIHIVSDTQRLSARSVPEDLRSTDNTLKIKVFPNPSTNEFQLKVEGNAAEKTAMYVMDASGRIVYRSSGYARQTHQFGSGLAPGIYIVAVVQGRQKQELRLMKR